MYMSRVWEVEVYSKWKNCLVRQERNLGGAIGNRESAFAWESLSEFGGIFDFYVAQKSASLGVLGTS